MTSQQIRFSRKDTKAQTIKANNANQTPSKLKVSAQQKLHHDREETVTIHAYNTGARPRMYSDLHTETNKQVRRWAKS